VLKTVNHTTPADEQDRDQVVALVEQVQELTGQRAQVAFVDQGDTDKAP